jgi:Domain of unknown function (DUF6933)
MGETVYTPTRSRSVLGTMNCCYRGLRCLFETRPTMTLIEYALQLSITPCGPMKYANPRNVTQFLLSDWRTLTFPPQVQ